MTMPKTAEKTTDRCQSLTWQVERDVGGVGCMVVEQKSKTRNRMRALSLSLSLSLSFSFQVTCKL